MPCSLASRVAARAVAILGGCGAYRPDDVGAPQQLAVIPKGFMFVAEGKVGGHGPEIQRLLLQRAEDTDYTLGHMHGEAEPSRYENTHHQPHLAAPQTSRPTSFQQSSANEGADIKNASSGAKQECVGKGNGGGKGSEWHCKHFFGSGSPTKSGKTCDVFCEDEYNKIAKTPQLTCEDGEYFNGATQEDPTCDQRKQCRTSGPGWKCKAVGKAEALNVGAKCVVECDECEGKSDKQCAWKVTIAEAHCKEGRDDGQWEPEPSCEEKKHCESKTEEFECADHSEGREPVQSGKACSVKCVDPKLHPSEATVTCEDGSFTSKPSCGAEPPPKKASGSGAKPSFSVNFLLSAGPVMLSAISGFTLCE